MLQRFILSSFNVPDCAAEWLTRTNLQLQQWE